MLPVGLASSRSSWQHELFLLFVIFSSSRIVKRGKSHQQQWGLHSKQQARVGFRLSFQHPGGQRWTGGSCLPWSEGSSSNWDGARREEGRSPRPPALSRDFAQGCKSSGYLRPLASQIILSPVSWPSVHRGCYDNGRPGNCGKAWGCWLWLLWRFPYPRLLALRTPEPWPQSQGPGSDCEEPPGKGIVFMDRRLPSPPPRPLHPPPPWYWLLNDQGKCLEHLLYARHCSECTGVGVGGVRQSPSSFELAFWWGVCDSGDGGA